MNRLLIARALAFAPDSPDAGGGAPAPATTQAKTVEVDITPKVDAAPAPAAGETPVYTKEQYTSLVQREVGKVTAKYEARLASVTAEIEALKAQADSHLTDAQRAAKAQAKEAADLAALRASHEAATKELAKVKVGYAVEQRLSNLPLRDGVNRKVLADFTTQRVALAQDGKVTLRVDDDSDPVPLDDTSWQEYVAKHFTGFINNAVGSGAPHGKGNGKGFTPDKFAGLMGRDLMAAGFREKGG